MAMMKASLLLAFFLLFAGTLARHQQQGQQWQQQNQCQINRINALEPFDRVQAEAGVTEYWEPENQQFQCAGVEFIRHRIQPGGLLLPSYVNTRSCPSPKKVVLFYFLLCKSLRAHLVARLSLRRLNFLSVSNCQECKGVLGVVLPGCPETYESSSQQQQQQQFSDPSQQRGQRIQDRHQKVQNLYQGDVAAIPAGAAHWIYNDGNTELVVVVFFDTQNNANQLDANRRRFYLAGNPQAQSQQQQGQWQPMRQQQQGQSHRNAGNIFNGFDVEFLQEAFNVDRETAEKLQGQRDQRGHIVRVQQGLQIIRPPQSRQEQEQEQRGYGNGVDETICSLKLKENIDNPSHVDFANPQAGRISNLNNFKFPILRHLQLSAARGELHRNAIQSPQYMLNAHNLVYVTHGSLRVQIVNNQGESVFNDQLRRGQVVVIPQNFAVIKRANEEGARWISFRTNDNAITENLSGRVSAIRSLPVDVVANAYQVSREDAQKLKYNQRQTALFSPSSSRGQEDMLIDSEYLENSLYMYRDHNECQIPRINPLEPNEMIQAQGGYSEFFDSNDQQFQCAGVEVARHHVQPKGLFLPSYTNAAILIYVEQGCGIQGVMLPGCPETYEVSQQVGGFQDRHQRLYNFRKGDIIAIPAGAAHWMYNDGQEELIVVKFYLAGNPQQRQQQSPFGMKGQSQEGAGNIFQGFDVETLSEAFNVDRETAEHLRCQMDQRGHIIMVERGLQVVRPPMGFQGQEGGRNGIDETICSLKIRENIDASRADFYNPQAGSCTHLNSLKFPILGLLQLGAQRGVLHRNAIMGPFWMMNAHNIIFVTHGNMRMQIVNNEGQAVFDGQIKERQLVVVPQNFAVVKQAGEQGCRWISFRTNDNAMINTLAGKMSAMRALPVDVITNAYQMSREDAQKLKYSREEAVLFSPGSMSFGGWPAKA
ncbi:hypothetical protein OSB04_023237 [Centaurea solstitialis]|uniref:Cupin type-1 domain-containing protein n=1 Tax=Centaurea solstitialis TaxID=347529 RepID=A0AA38W980_9ASTR|nr:hypothetical protein OSB04_023237 [Centaurea solstitialis]